MDEILGGYQEGVISSEILGKSKISLVSKQILANWPLVDPTIKIFLSGVIARDEGSNEYYSYWFNNFGGSKDHSWTKPVLLAANNEHFIDSSKVKR